MPEMNEGTEASLAFSAEADMLADGGEVCEGLRRRRGRRQSWGLKAKSRRTHTDRRVMFAAHELLEPEWPSILGYSSVARRRLCLSLSELVKRAAST